MNVTDKAAHAERLRRDEALQMFMQEVREDAHKAFAASAAHETDKREEAHAILRALVQLDGAFEAAIAAKAIQDKKRS